jgi:hypothetical protein
VVELMGTLETVQNQRNELRQQLKDEKVWSDVLKLLRIQFQSRKIEARVK